MWKKNKEDKLYKFFLPTLEQILDLLFFSIELMRQLITVGQASFVFCLRCHSLAFLAYLIMENHSVSFLQVKWPQMFQTQEINTYRSCIGGSCIQLLNRGSYRLTKFVLCFPVKIYLRHLKLRFLCCFAHWIVFYKMPLFSGLTNRWKLGGLSNMVWKWGVRTKIYVPL